ncbi:MAG: AmmeMemoRadiSam system protein B [Planctomycetota bacterium]
MRATRPAAVAGRFYTDDPTALAALVDGFLAEPPSEPGAVSVLVVPHAGYVFSGQVAGRAYGRLREQVDRFRRVVLLGPAHRKPVSGIALPGCTGMETPLGTVAVDAELAARIAALPQVVEDAAAHAQEHSLEVQLPFLQRLLPERPVQPLLVGQASPPDVAAVLDRVWDEDALVVISTDLSHFLDQETATSIDRETVAAVEAGRWQDLAGERACGFLPLAGLLAHPRCPPVRCVDRRTSADTAGPRDAVVGYASFVG